MTSVFISYNRADVDFAQRLRDTIRAAGFSPWLDIDDIPKGAYWPDAIDAGLEASDAVVGVMTPESVESRNVKNEWDWALSNDKPLLLLMLRPCKVPHRYISINYIDCATDEEQGLTQLREALADPTKPLYRDDHAPVGTQRAVSLQTREATKPTDKNRSRMLAKVREFWVKGVLENSLHGAALLELGMEQRPEAVERAWDSVLHHEDYGDYPLPRGTKIADVFDDLGGELLILGEPGSGKTTTLLELARDLIARAEADETLPMPVVFNLSSWAEERKSLIEWLADELNTRYQVPKKIGKEWLENDQLLPLLDGLDEVKQEHRDACVDAINTFRQEHGFASMAVCSRVADYEALATKLRLQGAVVLQPLTLKQVDAYLASAGEELAAVRAVLDDDEKLQELVTSPLMLSIVTLAYRGTVLEDLPKFDTLEGRRKHLFDAYVDRMLKRRGVDERYTKEQTIHWLAWLAQQMSKHAQSVFYIEGLQPGWADLRRSSLITKIRIVGVFGLVYGLLGSLFSGTVLTVLGLGSFLIPPNYPGEIQVLLFFFLIGLGFGWLPGLVTGLRPGIRFVLEREMQPVELLGWSWSRFRRGALLFGLLSALLLGTASSCALLARSPQRYSIEPYTVEEEVRLVEATRDAIINSLHVGVIGGGLAGYFAGGFISGITGKTVEMRTAPNQGIKRSYRNAALIGFSVSLAIGFAWLPVLIAAGGQGSILENRLTGWPILILIVLILFATGLNFAFRFGGSAVVSHAILRRILYRSGDAPLNYAAFLDYAASRVLLRKVGGGYIFVHRLLLNYFAELEWEKGKKAEAEG